MPSVLEMLEGKGLARVATQLASNIRQSARFCAAEYAEGPDNRIGGRPNLPSDVEWPRWRDQSLAFIAQLDLATLPPVEGLDLPRVGALYFFYEGGEEAWGFSPDDRSAWQIYFSERSPGDFSPRDYPSDLPEELRLKGIRLFQPEVEPTVPGGQDVLLDHLAMTPQERELYDAFLEEWDSSHLVAFQPLPGYPKWVKPDSDTGRIWDQERYKHPSLHRIGGYPDCVQFADPKLEAQLVSHGLYCGDATGYLEGERSGLSAGAVDWQLLLQVDCEPNADMDWGDSGRVYFLIHKLDLENRRFDKVWLVSQTQ